MLQEVFTGRGELEGRHRLVQRNGGDLHVPPAVKERQFTSNEHIDGKKWLDHIVKIFFAVKFTLSMEVGYKMYYRAIEFQDYRIYHHIKKLFGCVLLCR